MTDNMNTTEWRQKLRRIWSQNAVLIIAVIAAAVTMFFVPPDAAYADYFDWKTLCCLFSVLAVVCALRNIRFFTRLARQVVTRFRTIRSCCLALCSITFLGSMVMANDMALITFLPLGAMVLQQTGQQQYMAFVFIMQNISANLGGMLTPFGNPQNLYLFSYYHIPSLEFMGILLPLFLVAVAMIVLCCLFVHNDPLTVPEAPTEPVNRWYEALLLGLFVLSVVMVFRGIPYPIGTAAVAAVLLIADRRALRQVDYGLLATFAAFFVFAGNMARISAVRSFFAAALQKSTLLFSELCCQLISNVPSAVLLSHFTDNYADLLRGVNIGGTGTLIASLASLITFREFIRQSPGTARRYLRLFAVLNALFLVVLTGVAALL